MGLDMFALSTATNIRAVDFPEPADAHQIFYWRKHPDLHGWMEALYRLKGGNADEFNCVPVRIDANDLDALEFAVNADELPFTTGFFFGQSLPEDKQEDLSFIRAARTAIANGNKVYYASWW